MVKWWSNEIVFIFWNTGKKLYLYLKIQKLNQALNHQTNKQKKNLYNVVFCIVGNEEMLVKQSPMFNEHHFRYNL